MSHVAITLACCALLGCGSSTSTQPPVTGDPAGPSTAEQSRQAAQAERARRAELGAAHRKKLDVVATALAATCERPDAPAEPRCLPSCYVPEASDPRAATKVGGAAEIMHLVCTRSAGTGGPFLIADEIAGARLAVRAVRGRLPKSSRKGTWRSAVEAEVRAMLEPELARGDVVRVTGTWARAVHPVSKEQLRCVPVSHYVRSLRRPLDACGSRGSIACEATKSAAAHGLNVVHYRLAEARRLQAAGEDSACQQAALEAIAVARGMPRWRQYMTLNTDRWKASPRYRTRFDGVVDEDTLFRTAIERGVEAEQVYTACGGPATPRTTAAQEQSFHTCW